MSRVRSHARLSIGAFCLHILLSLTGSFAFSQGGVITTFSGVVKQKDGTVVVHAPIQLTVGQDVPQTTFSDSRGAFHVEVPSSARSLHISIYAPGFEVFEGDLNIRRTGPEIIYLQKLATKLANGGSASRTTAKDQAPSLTTYGDKSPIVTGNGSSVIYNDAPDPDKPYIRYLPDGETKTVSGG